MLEDGASNIGKFEGYASVWGSVDLGGDMIQKGAYANTLNQWKSKGMLPQLLWYHDMGTIIGDWTEMIEDDIGLKVSGQLWVKGDTRIETAMMAYNVLKGTSVKGLSIGYVVIDADSQTQMDGSTIRALKEINLMEVSIAPYAMEPKASVTSVKSLRCDDGSIMDKREVEKGLRDAGLSRNQAKAFISQGYDAAFQCDAEDDKDTQLLKELKTLNSLLGN